MAYLSSSEMLDIVNAVDRAVYEAFQIPTLSEPQLVANLVWTLPHYINQVKFSGVTKVSAGGIFVHAQPFVVCNQFPENEPKSVEIGDLLLVRTLVEKNAVVERHALLLQAKKVDSVPAIPDNGNQWYLYDQWPEFTYAKNSGFLTGLKRRVKEPDMYDAAKYLLIGPCAAANSWPRTRCIGRPCSLFYKYRPDICGHYTAHPTKPKISRYMCFAEEVVDFLVGNAGKVFIDPPMGSCSDGWHQVIRDLLNETANAKSIFMARAAGQSGKTVRGSAVLFMTPTMQSTHFLVAGSNGATNSNLPPDVPSLPDVWSQDEDGGGISIIEVVIQQDAN